MKINISKGVPKRRLISLAFEPELYDELNEIAEFEGSSFRGVVEAFIKAALPEYYEQRINGDQ